MRNSFVAVLLALSVAGVVAAEELTVDQVISAHKFGAPAESILARVNDPTTTVASLAADAVTRLQASGVPEAVIQALLARAKVAAPTAVTPDNPRLVELVRLVKSGLTESLTIDLIQGTPNRVQPTANDLVYLKENQVPDAVIAALMVVSPPAAGGAKAAAPSRDVELDGLVLMTSFARKNRDGKILLTEDRILWRDSVDSSRNLEIFGAGLKRITVECQARGEDSFCHEVNLDMAKGGDFTFRDQKRDLGGNEAIVRFLDALKVAFPDVPYQEKVK